MSDSGAIRVMMPKIVRKTLGLADGAFSHIAIHGGGLVFRSDGVTRPVRLRVSMFGTFHSNILDNLFVYLSNNRQNGILGITTGPLTKAVFFKRGKIVFSGSTDARERIGAYVEKLGFATREQIESVDAHDDPRRYGVRLKDAGIITHEQLWESLRLQVVGICYALIDFPVGSYFFLPGTVPPDSFNHFSIEPSQVLYRGMIQKDEYDRDARINAADLQDRTPLEILSYMEEGED